MSTPISLSDMDETYDLREQRWQRAMRDVQIEDLLEAVCEEITSTPNETPLDFEARRLLSDLPEPDYGIHYTPQTCEYVGRWLLGLLRDRYAATLTKHLERIEDVDF
jgi:hypothetical protein